MTDLVEAYLAFIESQPILAKVYIQIAVGGGNTTDHLTGRVLRHHRRRVERFGAAMRRDRPNLTADEAATSARFLLATLNGLVLSSIVDPSFDAPSAAKQLVEEWRA